MCSRGGRCDWALDVGTSNSGTYKEHMRRAEDKGLDIHIRRMELTSGMCLRILGRNCRFPSWVLKDLWHGFLFGFSGDKATPFSFMFGLDVFCLIYVAPRQG